MSGQARVSDNVVGTCSIGAKCCPHDWIGMVSVGSSNMSANGLSGARIGDFVVTNCPHCNPGIISTCSGYKKVNNLGAALIGSIVVLSCGVGMIITGSSDIEVAW